MRIGVVGQHLRADVVLDEVQAATGGGVVGVHQRHVTKCRGNGLALANDGPANPFDQVTHGLCSCGCVGLYRGHSIARRK